MPKKKRAIVIGVVIITSGFTAGFQQTNSNGDDLRLHGLRGATASVLVQQCKAVENYNVAKQSLPAKDAANAGFCMGFIGGILDFDKLESGLAKRHDKFCVPDSTGAAELAKILVKYGDSHPEELNLPAVAVFIYAITSAFPCA